MLEFLATNPFHLPNRLVTGTKPLILTRKVVAFTIDRNLLVLVYDDGGIESCGSSVIYDRCIANEACGVPPPI